MHAKKHTAPHSISQLHPGPTGASQRHHHKKFQCSLCPLRKGVRAVLLVVRAVNLTRESKIGMSPSVPSERGLARPHSAHKWGTVHNHPNVEHYDVALDLNVTWPMRSYSSQ